MINDFLGESLFQELISHPDINLGPCTDMSELNGSLNVAGWEVQLHPGCIATFAEYRQVREGKALYKDANSYGHASRHQLLSGSGIAYRYQRSESSAIQDRISLFHGGELLKTLYEKFEIHHETTYDCGLQKYLHGYEIPPHPDIRSKALAFMLNLNTDPQSNLAEYHTHFMRLKSKYHYLYKFWDNHDEIQHCWIP